MAKLCNHVLDIRLSDGQANSIRRADALRCVAGERYFLPLEAFQSIKAGLFCKFRGADWVCGGK